MRILKILVKILTIRLGAETLEAETLGTFEQTRVYALEWIVKNFDGTFNVHVSKIKDKLDLVFLIIKS